MSARHFKKVRVAIADDHAIIRDALRLALEADARIELVGTARTVAEAISLVRTTAPDVMIVDYRLSDTEVPELVCGLRERGYNTEIVVLASQAERRMVRAALDCGARAFLTKRTTDFERLTAAVLDAAAGKDTLSEDALSELLSSIRDHAPQLGSDLTPREREVWRFVSLGKSNPDIAKDIFLSERTVKFHVSNLLQKTGAKSRAELVAMAYRTGVMDASA